MFTGVSVVYEASWWDDGVSTSEANFLRPCSMHKASWPFLAPHLAKLF